MAEQWLLVERGDKVLRLTVNRPEKRNALSLGLLDEIGATLAQHAGDSGVHCVVISAAGDRCFAAGGDLQELDAIRSEADTRAMSRRGRAALDVVRAFPVPVIAALNGHALGGGLELALSCDLRIAARGAKLGMPPAKLGLIYSHTGLQKFIDAVGPARTREMFLTGRNLDAERAEAIGLVNYVEAAERIDAQAVELAAEIASNAPLSLRGNKRIIGDLVSFPRLTPDEQREVIDLRLSSFRTEDFREGVKAFGEKRKPLWRGR
jgi:enoyl-CoA hydratase/carnithine racemase